MIQRMFAIWSLVPLLLQPAWTSGSSPFTYCWSLAWRILSITLLEVKWVKLCSSLSVLWHCHSLGLELKMPFFFFFSLFYLFIYLFLEANYFTILYWFCHTLKWIRHGCTCVPHPEPPFPSLWVIPVHQPWAPCIMQNWLFIALFLLLSFPNLLHIECSTLIALSFRIWNSSVGIPSLPPTLFIAMLPKAHLTSHSRMFGSRLVTTQLWLNLGH